MVLNRLEKYKKKLFRISNKIMMFLGIKDDPNRHDIYISRTSSGSRWVYVSYIADVFYNLRDQQYLNTHQNKREAIEIVKIFNKLGYNVYVQDYASSRDLPDLDVVLIFGHDPNLNRAHEKYPDAKVVLYATGPHYSHQNSMEKKLTDYVNKTYNAAIPYVRYVAPEPSGEVADAIIMIGSKYTAQTYPSNMGDKIHLIHQSILSVNNNMNISYSKENHFIFLASSGNILRGVPFLIDYFKKTPQLTLHWVGPIDDDYLPVVLKEITPNIQLHGFLPIGGEILNRIISLCNFVIFPTGSDSGYPGSVLSLMKMGLIPIVSKWAATDETRDYGYIMEGWDYEMIEPAVEWALSLDPTDIEKRKIRARTDAITNYNIHTFCSDFYKAINNYL